MDYQKLAENYGTPLYIYNVDDMKNRMLDYKKNFVSKHFKTEIAYASKAFCVKEMLRLVDAMGLSLDVVSLGELYTAKSVSFDTDKIYFHGNNKSEEELSYALDVQVGTIVVDNLLELERLKKLTEARKQAVQIMIRLNAGIEAHTHRYIVTGHVDSKFGVIYQSQEYIQMISLIEQSEWICLKGFHSHIGSQIFDLTAYKALIQKLVAICKDFKDPLILNLGGGFGVRYVASDKPIPVSEVAHFLIENMEACLEQEHVTIEKLVIEPGRSIVAEAGSTLYHIGGIKQTPNKLYYFIDGGMTDNIRPALYQASYAADIVGKEEQFKNLMVTVAGKCCESGDLIIENILLPQASVGDLLVTYSTGAYGYSMSSNYNKALTPAVVFVEGNQARLAVKRQSLQELIEREL